MEYRNKEIIEINFINKKTFLLRLLGWNLIVNECSQTKKA